MIAYNASVVFNIPSDDISLTEIKYLNALASEDPPPEYDLMCQECAQPGTIIFVSKIGSNYNCSGSGVCHGGYC